MISNSLSLNDTIISTFKNLCERVRTVIDSVKFFHIEPSGAILKYDNSYFSGNSNYADPTSFAVSNSAHYGFQFSSKTYWLSCVYIL